MVKKEGYGHTFTKVRLKRLHKGDRWDKKEVIFCLDWLAAEHKYAEDLLEDVNNIEKEEVSDRKKEIRKAVKVLKYIARSERRVHPKLISINKKLKKLGMDLGPKSKLIQEFKEIRDDLNLADRFIFKYSSEYEGLLAQDLHEIEETAISEAKLQTKERMRSSFGKQKNLERLEEKFHGFIEKIQKDVKDLDKWVKSLVVSLERVKRVVEEYNKTTEEGSNELYEAGIRLLHNKRFPVNRYKTESKFLAYRLSELKRISRDQRLTSASFFGTVLPDLAEKGLVNEEYWRDIYRLIDLDSEKCLFLSLVKAFLSLDVLVSNGKISWDEAIKGMLRVGELGGEGLSGFLDKTFVELVKLSSYRRISFEQVVESTIELSRSKEESSFLFRDKKLELIVHLINTGNLTVDKIIRDMLRLKGSLNFGGRQELFSRTLPLAVQLVEAKKVSWDSIVKGLLNISKRSKVDGVLLYKYIIPSLILLVFSGKMSWDEDSIVIPKLLELVRPNRREVFGQFFFNMVQKGFVQSKEDWENMDKMLANPDVEIKSYEQLMSFLMVVCLDIKQMKKPLKNLIANLLTKSIPIRPAAVESQHHRVESFFNFVLEEKNLDSETKYLIRKVASMLPIGRKEDLFNLIRGESVVLKNMSSGLLSGIRLKIHNNPGKEDIKVIFEYLKFLDTGDITGFKRKCMISSNYNLQIIDFDAVLKARMVLKRDTKEIAESLLIHLKSIFLDKGGNFDQNLRKFKRIVPEEVLGSKKWKNFSGWLERISKHIDSGDFLGIAKIIGHCRRDLHKLRSTAKGNFSNELYYFDLFLENLEKLVYAELNTGKDVETFEEFEANLFHIEQLLNSVIYSNMGALKTWLKNEEGHYVDKKGKVVGIADRVQIEVKCETSFQKGLLKLKKYFVYKEKDVHEGSLNAVIEALNLIQKGIDLFSEAVISELRGLIEDRVGDVSNKEEVVEDFVAPFYKTGAIYLLGELSAKLLNFLTGGEGLIVCNGKAWGKVRIVRNSTDVAKFRSGEVFIAQNPTPEVNVAMIAASAIITQEGGSTSHAAMIAREHKVPCIVAKARACSDFKTGDYVIVDADKGVIEKISKSRFLELPEAVTVQTVQAELKELSLLNLFPMSYLEGFLRKRGLKHVVYLDESSDVNLVGGKAINLFRLRKIKGLNVPNGFTVTVSAFVKTILHNYGYLSTRLVNYAKMSEKQIENVFLGLEIPSEIEKEIKAAYAGIGRGHVSIRSSATTEDTADSTFAGLHSSYLFRRGISLVLRNIKKCWASLYTARAVKHRHKLAVEEKKAKMAVVVQKMVYADYSGVVYTEITERFSYYVKAKGGIPKKKWVVRSKDKMKLEVVSGSGEDLVSGRKTPMIFVVDKSGLEFEQISGRVRKDFDKVISDVIKASLLIERKYFGLSQDIEFCVKKGKLYILQTRNIAVSE